MPYADERVGRILGKGPQSYGHKAYGARYADAGLVARKIERLLASLKEVESASGTIVVKVVGQPSKKVTFRYG
jgi:hypothetical protein